MGYQWKLFTENLKKVQFFHLQRQPQPLLSVHELTLPPLSHVVVRCGAFLTVWLCSAMTSSLEVWRTFCSGQYSTTTTRTLGVHLHPVCNTALWGCLQHLGDFNHLFDMADIHLFLPPPGRPPPFYEALAKEAYNTHITNPEVSSLVVSSSSDRVYPLYHQPHTARLCLHGCLY